MEEYPPVVAMPEWLEKHEKTCVRKASGLPYRHHRGKIGELSKEKETMVKITMMARGICQCGRLYLIFQPEVSEVAQRMRNIIGNDIDVFICDVPEVHCSGCDQVISLPAPEILDVDRQQDIAGIVKLYEEKESGEKDAGRIEPDDDVPFRPSDKN